MSYRQATYAIRYLIASMAAISFGYIGGLVLGGTATLLGASIATGILAILWLAAVLIWLLWG